MARAGGNFTDFNQTAQAFGVAKEPRAEFWMNGDLPPLLSSPRPTQFQLLFVLGATFYYLQNSTGEISRLVLPGNKDLAILPQELKRGGRGGGR